jgi:hypothetical protein
MKLAEVSNDRISDKHANFSWILSFLVLTFSFQVLTKDSDCQLRSLASPFKS